MVELEEGLHKANLSVQIVPRGMGFKDGSEDVRLFKAALLSGRVVPRRQLLLRAALSETILVSDPAGNQKISKAGEGGRRRQGRDDPAVAVVLAVAESERAPAPASAPEMGFTSFDDM